MEATNWALRYYNNENSSIGELLRALSLGYNIAGRSTEEKGEGMSISSENPTDWGYIAEMLACVDGTFPFAAVHEARDDWPKVREHFFAELVRAVADPEGAIDEENALPIYAIYLAAEKCDAAFAQPMLDLLRLPIEQIDGLIGDSLTDGMGRCLASVHRGDDAPIRALAADDDRDIYVRLAAIDALVVRTIEGDAEHEDVARFIFSLAQPVAAALIATPPSRPSWEQRDDDDVFFNLLVVTLAELGATQYWPMLEQWDRDGLIDPQHEDLPGLRATMFASREERIANMLKPHYVRDAIAEMSWWACFNEEPVETYVRDQPKVGRNDPCPCGSGKKFKKCCGADL